MPKDVRGHVFAHDRHACRQCGAVENLTIDHITPRALGGNNHFKNLATLCEPCNQAKGDSLPVAA